MSSLAGRRVVLGVSGGIASYKACVVARRLTEEGAAVDVVMTASAAEFVGPVTFEALTARPVVTSLWDRGRALDHVKLGRETDLIVVAPATAQIIARMAQGLADDFLSTLLLARKAPVLVCPAMNDQMWMRPETQANVAHLRGTSTQGHGGTGKVTFLGPVTGPLAHGEGEGPGRMVEPEEIVAHAMRLLRGTGALAGKNVVVTAGPTREPLDPVRVISNRSSGRMGYALARSAWLSGADVTLISGPTSLAAPTGCKLVRVETTEDLQNAVSEALPAADVLLMAAAPADYAPGKAGEQKMVREAGPVKLLLEPTADVLASTAYWRKAGALMVGFALESGDPVPRAREKLLKKQLDLIIANKVGPGTGPDVATNEVTLVTADKVEALPMMSKDAAADEIISRVVTMLKARGH